MKNIHEIDDNLHIGEKIESHTALISVTLEKVSPNNTSGKHLLQPNGAEIRFPNLFINESIIIKVRKLPAPEKKRQLSLIFFLFSANYFTIFINRFINTS